MTDRTNGGCTGCGGHYEGAPDFCPHCGARMSWPRVRWPDGRTILWWVLMVVAVRLVQLWRGTWP